MCSCCSAVFCGFAALGLYVCCGSIGLERDQDFSKIPDLNSLMVRSHDFFGNRPELEKNGGGDCIPVL